MAIDKDTLKASFVRLTNKRVPKALKALQLIENLGRYPHNHEHTTKIMAALKAAVEKVEYALGGEKQPAAHGFQIGDEEE